jgi:hypothetical protein
VARSDKRGAWKRLRDCRPGLMQIVQADKITRECGGLDTAALGWADG